MFSNDFKEDKFKCSNFVIKLSKLCFEIQTIFLPFLFRFQTKELTLSKSFSSNKTGAAFDIFLFEVSGRLILNELNLSEIRYRLFLKSSYFLESKSSRRFNLPSKI